jgi:hypothetical protein
VLIFPTDGSAQDVCCRCAGLPLKGSLKPAKRNGTLLGHDKKTGLGSEKTSHIIAFEIGANSLQPGKTH